MTKSKLILTACALMLAVGGVFASAFAPETGYIFDDAQPSGFKCIDIKDCQLTNTNRPLCTVESVQLYRQTASDVCSTVVLYELPE